MVGPSSSPCLFLLHIVPRCDDYRAPNNATVPDRNLIPHNSLRDEGIFSKLDLVHAYYHIPVAPENIPKTVITTLFGFYGFLRVTFSLKNGLQTFPRFTDQVPRGLSFVFVYIDDVIIAKADEVKYREHFCLVFQRFQRYDISVDTFKCILAVPPVEFLGRHFDGEGI